MLSYIIYAYHFPWDGPWLRLDIVSDLFRMGGAERILTSSVAFLAYSTVLVREMINNKKN